MNRKEINDFMVDFFKAWKDGAAEKVPTFYAENLKAYSDFQPISLTDILARFEYAQRKFVELEHGVQDLFIDETQGTVAIRMKQDHVLRENPAERIACEVISLYTVVNFKITEIWMSFYPNIDYLNNQ
jgi:hypothetical protein